MKDVESNDYTENFTFTVKGGRPAAATILRT